MDQTVSIGRLWGIEIRLHPSLLLIALLTIGASAFGFLPALAPIMEHGQLLGMLNRRDITYRT